MQDFDFFVGKIVKGYKNYFMFKFRYGEDCL